VNILADELLELGADVGFLQRNLGLKACPQRPRNGRAQLGILRVSSFAALRNSGPLAYGPHLRRNRSLRSDHSRRLGPSLPHVADTRALLSHQATPSTPARTRPGTPGRSRRLARNAPAHGCGPPRGESPQALR